MGCMSGVAFTLKHILMRQTLRPGEKVVKKKGEGSIPQIGNREDRTDLTGIVRWNQMNEGSRGGGGRESRCGKTKPMGSNYQRIVDSEKGIGPKERGQGLWHRQSERGCKHLKTEASVLRTIGTRTVLCSRVKRREQKSPL